MKCSVESFEMFFFFNLLVFARKLATQRESPHKFNMWPLATTFESVWPGLKDEAKPLGNLDRSSLGTVINLFTFCFLILFPLIPRS